MQLLVLKSYLKCSRFFSIVPQFTCKLSVRSADKFRQYGESSYEEIQYIEGHLDLYILTDNCNTFHAWYQNTSVLYRMHGVECFYYLLFFILGWDLARFRFAMVVIDATLLSQR